MYRVEIGCSQVSEGQQLRGTEFAAEDETGYEGLVRGSGQSQADHAQGGDNGRDVYGSFETEVVEHEAHYKIGEHF